MAKTNSSFNLSKNVKRVLASIVDPDQRAIYRRAMIEAEHSYIVNRHRKFKETATGTANGS